MQVTVSEAARTDPALSAAVEVAMAFLNEGRGPDGGTFREAAATWDRSQDAGERPGLQVTISVPTDGVTCTRRLSADEIGNPRKLTSAMWHLWDDVLAKRIERVHTRVESSLRKAEEEERALQN